MRKTIFSTSPWVLFIAFFLGATAADVAASMVGKSLGWDWDYGAFPTLRFSLISLVWWSYPLLVTRALSITFDPGSYRKLLWVILLAVVNNALSVNLINTYGLIWYIILITAVINLFCAASVFVFPARALKSAELNRAARIYDYWREYLLFVLWPLCAWWLQPRLKSISHEAAKSITSAS